MMFDRPPEATQTLLMVEIVKPRFRYLITFSNCLMIFILSYISDGLRGLILFKDLFYNTFQLATCNIICLFGMFGTLSLIESIKSIAIFYFQQNLVNIPWTHLVL